MNIKELNLPTEQLEIVMRIIKELKVQRMWIKPKNKDDKFA